jgi:hypothetical protein
MLFTMRRSSPLDAMRTLPDSSTHFVFFQFVTTEGTRMVNHKKWYGGILLCAVSCAVLTRWRGGTATALVGESKGLSAQAHDLGWDGGRDYRSSGVSFSSSPNAWRDLTSAPAYEDVVAPEAPESWQQTRARSSAQRAPEAGGGLSAISSGLKAAWDHLAMDASGNGCDAACLKDIYRRAFRAHKSRRARTPSPRLRSDDPQDADDSDDRLFGQVTSMPKTLHPGV